MNGPAENLSLCGWLRTANARDAGLVARYYRYRYNNEDLGEQVAESRFQGDSDWTYVWDQLILPENTGFLNVRWQLYGAEEGDARVWCDDVEIIRWEDRAPFVQGVSVDTPNDLYYVQVETTTPVEEVEITYRTESISY